MQSHFAGIFHQLFRFVQTFDLGDHLFRISFVVNPVNLIVIPQGGTFLLLSQRGDLVPEFTARFHEP